jgi:oligo-1,6-glucosidase
MQWDDRPNAGSTTGTPWIVNPNYREINAAAAAADQDSVFAHYRRLAELRHTEPAVVHGDFTMLLPDDEQVYAFSRCQGDVELLVLRNFSGASVAAEIPDAAEWTRSRLLLGNYPPPAPGETRLLLRPWETLIYRRVRAAGGGARQA